MGGIKHAFNKVTGHDARKKAREAARREEERMRQQQEQFRIENENNLMLQGSVGAGDVDATAIAGTSISDYSDGPSKRKKKMGTTSNSLGIN